MTNETQNIPDESQFILVLPRELEVEFRDEIGTKTVQLHNKTVEWFIGALGNGLRQSIADAVAGKAGTDEGQKAIEAKYQRVCVEGNWPTGGGGGGARLTPETAGWIEYFKSKDSPVKFKGKVPSRNTLDEYLAALTKKAIWGHIQAQIKGMDKNAQIEFHKTEVPKLIEKAMPKLREREEALKAKGTPGWFIQVERDKRAGKKSDDGMQVAPLDLDF